MDGVVEPRQKVLLFIHGIRHDDPEQTWRTALDATLRREGLEDLDARGYVVVAPSYLEQLEAPQPPQDVTPPEMTYRKGTDDAHRSAAGTYWSNLASLEGTGIRGHIGEFALGSLPGDDLAAAGMPFLFEDAAAYRKDPKRRHAIFAQVLKAIPPNADLVIVAHSLGSVVAADLVYHLPRDARLRMLVTIGSPLSLKPLRDHLQSRKNRFPYEVMGPWLNVVGTKDGVTGFRGFSRVVPEALDIFVDTGIVPHAVHSAAAYLHRAPLAKAISWLDDRHESAGSPDKLLPAMVLPPGLLPMVVGAQYSLRLEQAQEAGDARARFAQARRLVTQSLADRLRGAGQDHPVLRRLMSDNSDALKGQFDSEQIITMLLSAWTSNPVMPYEIRMDSGVRRVALEHLAIDLGVPSTWARAVVAAEGDARKSHDAGWSWTRAALVVAGAAAIAAAPFLVLAAAPAGLAGGAAIVAGLAALGPGGMLGGVGIVSLLGGAGGAMAAQALVSGSAEQVEETVIHLQAFASVVSQLDPTGADNRCWMALIAMDDAITDELARHRLFSDSGAQLVKQLKKKLESVRSALAWLEERKLDPARLSA